MRPSGRDHDVLGPQVVVAHAAPRQAPRPDGAGATAPGRSPEPGELEPAERLSGYSLKDEDLPAVGLDQLERRRDAGQAAAAPQQIELAAQILPAPRRDLPLLNDLVETIIREAEAARRIQRAGPALALHRQRLRRGCPGASPRRVPCRAWRKRLSGRAEPYSTIGFRTVADLISVITVNLDDAAGLRATAQSVAAQERPPERVDRGRWRLAPTARSRSFGEFEHLIHCWTSAPDRGVYDAMNQGLRSAQGRYVMFMNAGDRFAAPDSLALVAAALRASPGVDLLFGGTMLAFPSGRTWYRPPRPDRASALGSARLPSGHGDPPRRSPAGALRSLASGSRPTTARSRRWSVGAPASVRIERADRDPRLPWRRPVRTSDRVTLRRLRRPSSGRSSAWARSVSELTVARLALLIACTGRCAPVRAPRRPEQQQQFRS